MPNLPVNGIELYCERSGAGAPVLFLNGSGSTLTAVAPLVALLARDVDVVAYDQRGLGRSAIPPGPYSMADYADDALGIMDAVRWPACRVVGVSFGGMVAQEVAVTAPERVERLALLCTSPGGAGGSSYPLHELATVTPRQRAETSAQLLDTRFTPAWLSDHPADRKLVDAMAERRSGAVDEDARRGELLQLEARRHHDVWDRLVRIGCPTFVGAGRYDGIAPVANSEAITSRISGAALHVYDGGHAFFVQDPRALPEVVEFLAS
jgi:3-oxoadipate enol-lactonase